MKVKPIMPIFICLIVLWLFLPASGFAQNGVIRIQCADLDGDPLKDVKVSVLDLNDTLIEIGNSDKNGAVVFENVADGFYRVVARKRDYVPEFYEFVKVRASVESVSLTFDRGMDKLLYFEDPARIRSSSSLVAEGINASKEGRYSVAERNLLQATEKNPSSPEAFYYLGIFYVQTKEFDKAVEVLNEASTLAEMFAALPPVAGKNDPSRYKAVYNDAQSLIKNMAGVKGQIALQEKDYDKAVEAFREVVMKSPDDPEAHYELALSLTYAGQFDQAMDAINKSLQLKSGDSKFNDLKSQISARIENAAIRKAQAIIEEGEDLLKTGDTAAAIDKFQGAVKLIPLHKQAPILRRIGELQAELNQTEAAAATLKQAAELAPEEEASDYMKVLAQFYLDSKKYEEALDALTDTRALGSESVEKVLLDLVEKTKNREPKFAEASLERVIKTNPSNADAHFTLGQMYYADGREMDERTRELLTKYIEIGEDPNKIRLAKDMLVLVNRRSE